MAAYAPLDGDGAGRTRLPRHAWAEHEAIAAYILAGDTAGAEAAAQAHALTAGRATEQRLKAPERAA